MQQPRCSKCNSLTSWRMSLVLWTRTPVRPFRRLDSPCSRWMNCGVATVDLSTCQPWPCGKQCRPLMKKLGGDGTEMLEASQLKGSQLDDAWWSLMWCAFHCLPIRSATHHECITIQRDHHMTIVQFMVSFWPLFSLPFRACRLVAWCSHVSFALSGRLVVAGLRREVQIGHGGRHLRLQR